MSLGSDVRDQLLASFRVELAEYLQAMSSGLLDVERGRVAGADRQALLADVLRAAHSLKGAARAIGLKPIAELAHAVEDVLAALRADEAPATATLFSSLFQALDAMQGYPIEDAAAGAEPPATIAQALAALASYRRQSDAVAPPAAVAVAGPAAADAAAPGVQPAAPREPTAAAGATTQAGARPDTTAAGAARPPDEMIRVSAAKLDALIADVSELLVARIHADQRRGQARLIGERIGLWQREGRVIRSHSGRLRRRLQQAAARRGETLDPDIVRLLEYLDASHERLRELAGLAGQLAQDLDGDSTRLGLLSTRFEEGLKRTRVLPLRAIVGPFERMVRDLAQAAGKSVVLRIVGATVEFDKHVLEEIRDPLIHLVRNAVDHGIEPPDLRAAEGKPMTGTIVLSAEQIGPELHLVVRDDGAGLDIERIRRSALEQGLGGAEGLGPTELIELAFEPGISTRSIVTEVSGRGLGLDIVRRQVESLRGHITVDSQLGSGTTITLALPLALAAARGLMVRAAGQLYALPANSVERILRVEAGALSPVEGHTALVHEGRAVRLEPLAALLELRDGAAPAAARALLVVLVVAGGQRLALAVDELAGEQEIVVKNLAAPLRRIGGVAGATVLGDGAVVPVLDAADLIKLAGRSDRPARGTQPAAPAPAPRARRTILVVDDSITTRLLEKNILEAAGYRVQLATNGQEALDLLASGGLPDLIVSDVAMPVLDGIELTRALRANVRTAGLPVVLLTSLHTPADQSRGVAAGADAYVMKSTFNQDELLALIEQLIE